MTTLSPLVLSDVAACQAELVLSQVSMTVGARLAALAKLTDEVRALAPEARLASAVGIGAHLARAWLQPAPPKLLAPFVELRGPKQVMPATQGDLCVLVEGDRPDLVFELLLRARRAFGGGATVREEVHGFRYLDGRDLSGFLDGTGNPAPEERPVVAQVGVEDPDYEGGSYLFTQRWLHDLDAVRRMSIPERERMIGRRLSDNLELDDTEKPPDAHMSRVEIVENGQELAIHRKSFPFGDSSAQGLMFVAFARDPSIFTKMLTRMVGAGPDGLRDRIFTFSKPVSGGFYFVPTQEVLAAIAS